MSRQRNEASSSGTMTIFNRSNEAARDKRTAEGVGEGHVFRFFDGICIVPFSGPHERGKSAV